jgi:hypothetical protein
MDYNFSNWEVYRKRQYTYNLDLIRVTPITARASRKITFSEEVKNVIGDFCQILVGPNGEIGLRAASETDRDAYKISLCGMHTYSVNANAVLRQRNIEGGLFSFERHGNIVVFKPQSATP